MNILSLVFALAMILVVLTIEQVELFKNEQVVRETLASYQPEAKELEFNRRESKLYDYNVDSNIKQLSFRYLIDKKARESNEAIAKQYRLLIASLIQRVYAQAPFFQELQRERGNFVEELLNAVEQAADRQDLKGRVRDIAQLDLQDPQLQQAYYRILKGSVSREAIDKKKFSPEDKALAYPSLQLFLNESGREGGSIPKIRLQHAPVQILMAIFPSDEVVKAVLIRRKELGERVRKASKEEKDGVKKTATQDFEREFLGQQREGIDGSLLSFEIRETKKNYD